MAINFPSNPTVGDIYTFGTIPYEWDGVSWTTGTSSQMVGYTGSQGSQGVIGYTGSTGYVGSSGTTGYTGSQGDAYWTAASGGIVYGSGNVGITGTGARITGDFSNATVANRVMFQTSTTNGNASIGVVPNGTATVSDFTAYGTTDVPNSSYGMMRILASNVMQIESGKNGTGTYLPMTFYTGGSESFRCATDGTLTVSKAAGLGYGTGAGGTVTQATSKSTTVTLNKPTGKITVHNAALAAGGYVEFLFSNSTITANDTVVVNPVAGTYSGAASTYLITAVPGPGYAYIVIHNRSGSSYSEAFQINFAVIKGATT